MRDSIVIERNIKAPINRVFDAFVTSEDLMVWHNAGDGWQTPYAEVNPVYGGKIKIAYADPDGNVQFDLEAIIEEIDRPNKYYFRMGMEDFVKDDDRLVNYDFTEIDSGTHVRLEFDVETINDKELQRSGWTNHIDNLQKYLES